MTGLTFDCGDDGIAILTIDIPGKTMNLATPELGRALAEAVARVAGDPAIKGAVVTSAKADFMAGGDIHALVNGFGTLGDAATVYRNIARPFSEMLRRLETCGKAFVAAINGSALGGGLELALACHYRIVSDAEKLIIAMPEVTIGLIPGAGGTQRLPRMIGIRQAVRLMLDGTRLTPAEALKQGVVDAVVAPGELMQAARAWVASCTEATQPWDRKGYVVPGGAGFFDPAITAFFNAEATAITVKTHHNLPAPIALLDAVAHGTAVPIEAGLRIEARAFTKLLMEPTARNLMRTEFISKGACDKLAARPAGIARRPPARIGVIGAGLMGAGLAQVSAEAGLDVVLMDVSAEQAAASLERIGRAYAKKVERGTLTRACADAALARITPTEDYAALAPCDLVVEAVFEDQAVKQAVLARAAAVLRPDAVARQQHLRPADHRAGRSTCAAGPVHRPAFLFAGGSHGAGRSRARPADIRRDAGPCAGFHQGAAQDADHRQRCARLLHHTGDHRLSVRMHRHGWRRCSAHAGRQCRPAGRLRHRAAGIDGRADAGPYPPRRKQAPRPGRGGLATAPWFRPCSTAL